MKKKALFILLILSIAYVVYSHGEYTYYKMFPARHVIVQNFENKTISTYFDIVKQNNAEVKPSLVILNSRLNQLKPLLNHKIELKKLSDSQKINILYCCTFQDEERQQMKDWFVLIHKNKIEGTHIIVPNDFNNYKTLRRNKFEKGRNSDDTPYYIIIDKNGEMIQESTSDYIINYNEIINAMP